MQTHAKGKTASKRKASRKTVKDRGQREIIPGQGGLGHANLRETDLRQAQSQRVDQSNKDWDQSLRAVIAQQLDVEQNLLIDDAALEPLVTDDTSVAGLLGAVGDELNVRFPDDFLDGLDTYAQFISAIKLAVGDRDPNC